MDDNPFSPGSAGGFATTAQNFDPAPVDLMAIFERAWRLMLDNIAIVAVGIVLMLSVSIASAFVAVPLQIYAETSGDETTNIVATLARVAIQVLAGVIQMFFQLGLLKALINLDRGSDEEMSVVWSQGSVLISAVLASLIVGLSSFVGFLLLIVPGIIIVLGLSMTLLIIVDERTDPVSAVQQSWEMTTGHKGFLFIQGFLMVVLTLGIYVVTCCLGAPVAVGMACAVQAVTYNALKGSA